MDDFRRMFLEEARELLERVSDDVLQAEANPDDKDILHSIFRSIHTLKGNAGTFEADAVSAFAHHLEGVLDVLRNDSLGLEPEIVDLILAGADHLGTMLGAFEEGTEPSVNEALVLQLKKVIADSSEGVFDADFGAGDNSRFLQECREGLAAAADFLDRLRREPDNKDLLDDFYTEVHIVVAGAGLNKLETVVKAGTPLEEILIRLRDGDSALPIPVTELQRELRFLDDTVAALTTGGSLPVADLSSNTTEKEAVAAVIPIIDEGDIAAFLEDAREHIDAMERAVIEYEKSAGRDPLDELFRGAHTIKGDADYLQLDLTTRFSHALEEVLDLLRREKLSADREIIDLLLDGVDGLRSIIQSLAKGAVVQELPAVYEQLAATAGIRDEAAGGGTSCVQDQLAALPDDMREVFLEQIFQQQVILTDHSKSPLAPDDYEIIKRALSGLERASAFVEMPTMTTLLARAAALLEGEESPLLVAVNEIVSFIDGFSDGPKMVGEILVADGSVSQSDLDGALEEQKPLGEILVEQGKVSREDVYDALTRQKTVGEILVEQGKVEESDVSQALKKQDLMEVGRALRPDKIAARESRTMRVDEDKVGEFGNLISEMLVARNSYEYLINGISKINTPQQLAAYTRSLKDNLHIFSRLVGDMHHQIMAMSMIPIKGIFQKYTRVVRDIARKQHKDIQLILRGEETEVDKKVADSLSDPLIHLIRNACDHGIESPVVRKKAGKPEKGTVTLAASHLGSNLIIEINDDGGGINLNKLVAKAMESGIDVDGMGEQEVLALIFRAGLSTMEQSTNLSGRGVGMDVVRNTIDSLGGNVHVSSREGEGTSLTMTVPMTMGISVVLLIEAGGQSYGFPFEHVLETIKIRPADLHKTTRNLMFHYRDQVIQARFLENILAHGGRSRETSDIYPDEDLSVVILHAAGKKLGIIVDSFVRNMEMAIKPLPAALAHIEAVSGASILGDGRLVLILNPANLVG